MTDPRRTLAQAIEHTLLRSDATTDQIDALCDEAVRFAFAGVCVNPIHVRRAADRLSRTAPPRPFVVAVVGFPLGANLTATKSDEARRALDDGAAEIDMVAPIGAVLEGDVRTVRADIEALARVVHQAPGRRLLKVIIETAVLPMDRLILACRCCAEGEADFVKTSTGFHPQGGATVEHVRLLHRHASPLRIKAAGGIRTADQAQAMLDAGAVRIGTSSGPTLILRPDGGSALTVVPSRLDSPACPGREHSL